MKRSLFFALVLIAIRSQAQFDITESAGTFKLSTAYAHDFPGLNGYALGAEFVKPIAERFEAGFGVRYINMSGNPRSETAREYTKATTLDFGVYVLPVKSEFHAVKIGGGYSFSFYNTRRSFPVISHTEDPQTQWRIQDNKGRVSGFTLSGEYEYSIPNSSISLGVRASLFKAYDRATSIGPFIGFRL
jgi:hypothetical protein